MILWISGSAVESPRFKVYPEMSRCLSRPVWLASSERMTSRIVGEIQEALAQCPSDTIFSEDLEEIIAARAVSSSWVESIQTLERVFPSQYRIELKLRQPTAVFRPRDRSYFIDGNGVVLAAVDQLDFGEVSTVLPLITGYDRSTRLVKGRKALDPKLEEGAWVSREIGVFDELGISSQVKVDRIDVTNFGQGKPDDVVLLTDTGVRIFWGRSSMDPRFQTIDPSPREKAEKLKKVLKERPYLAGVETVKLTFDKTFITLKAMEDGG
jgi:hypothetical protein